MVLSKIKAVWLVDGRIMGIMGMMGIMCRLSPARRGLMHGRWLGERHAIFLVSRAACASVLFV